jgi:hypothetical protein
VRSLPANVAFFKVSRDRLLDFRETELERWIEHCYNVEDRLAKWITKAAGPGRGMNIRVDISLIAQEGIELWGKATAAFEQLGQRLNKLAK